MGNEALVMGYETALDFWRASRVASEGQHVLEDAGRVFGPRALELHEWAALAALTSRAELVGYAKSARAVGVRGAGKAVRALDLAVFFLLSRRLGGAGLGGFAVNASLEAMGYTVMVATNDLVKDGTKLDAFVDDLTCRLGLRR